LPFAPEDGRLRVMSFGPSVATDELDTIGLDTIGNGSLGDTSVASGGEGSVSLAGNVCAGLDNAGEARASYFETISDMEPLLTLGFRRSVATFEVSVGGCRVDIVCIIELDRYIDCGLGRDGEVTDAADAAAFGG